MVRGTFQFTLSCLKKEGVLELDSYVFAMETEWLFLNQYDETSSLPMRSEHGFWSVEASTILDDIRENIEACLLYTSPSPRDVEESRMPSSA